MGTKKKADLEVMEVMIMKLWARRKGELRAMQVMIMKPWARRRKTDSGSMELMTAKCIHNSMKNMMIILLKKFAQTQELEAKMMITCKAARVVTNCAAAKAMITC